MILTMPKLEIRNGKAGGKVVDLTGSTITLGNRRNATVELKDAWVSFNHAQITREGDRYFIADAHSRSGTFVNERRVDRTPVPIAPGDRILLGKTEIMVLADAGATGAASAPPSAAATAKIAELEGQLVALTSKLESVDRDHRQATGDLKTLREHVVAREKELAATCEKLRAATAKPKTDPAEIAHWKKTVEDLKAAARQRLDEVGRYAKQLEARLQSQGASPEGANELIAKEREVARLHDEIARVKEESQKRLLEAAEKMQQLGGGDPAELEAERKRADDLEREAGILRSRVEDVEGEKKKLESDLKAVRSEISAYEQALEERNKDVERLEALQSDGRGAGGAAPVSAPAASSEDSDKLRAELATERKRADELQKQVVDLRTQVEEINQDMLEQEDELREEISTLEKKLAEAMLPKPG